MFINMYNAILVFYRANSNSSHVPLTAEFLKRLNSAQHCQNQEEEAAGLAWISETKDKKSKKVKPTSIKGMTALTAGRGLRNLCALGLRDTKISKQSISLLEQTLLLSSQTLTELDISNSFVGFSGAKMLARVLDGSGAVQVIQSDSTHAPTNPAAAAAYTAITGGADVAPTPIKVPPKHIDTQLISLRLSGNCLGDYGVSLLAQALQV